VRILENLNYYASRGSFASWAVALSRNLCKTKLRARTRRGLREVAIEGIGENGWSSPDSESGGNAGGGSPGGVLEASRL